MHQNSTIGCCEAKEGGGEGLDFGQRPVGRNPKEARE